MCGLFAENESRLQSFESADIIAKRRFRSTQQPEKTSLRFLESRIGRIFLSQSIDDREGLVEEGESFLGLRVEGRYGGVIDQGHRQLVLQLG